jgi:lipid II:glycine glycyltransferase (peptidoglycan interpeptide bridge formation enzyme)
MSKKKLSVFGQLQESLTVIAEQLDIANNALYVIATGTIDLNDKLDELSAKLDAIAGSATKVTAKTTEKPEVKPQEVPTFEFQKLRKEMK